MLLTNVHVKMAACPYTCIKLRSVTGKLNNSIVKYLFITMGTS